MIKKFIPVCLVLCASSALAAEETYVLSEGWNLYSYTMTFSGFAVPKDIQSKPQPAETIFTNSEDAGDIALTCLLDKLSSSIEVNETDFVAFVTGQPNTRRARYRDATLRINGEKISKNQWTYVPKYKVLLARNQLDTNRLYNAAVRGDQASIQISGKKIIELNLPKKNDTFANFGAACKLGRNR